MRQELSKGLVAMPLPTLNALKQLLFNDKGTVDISPIVNDMTTEENNQDLLAINIALVMKGMKPEIGKFRYKKEGDLLITWEMKHFSLINGIVTVKVSAHKYDRENKTFVDYSRIIKEECIEYSTWAEASADKGLLIDQFRCN